MGNGEWGMGDGEWVIGNGEWVIGNGGWVTGNRDTEISLRLSTYHLLPNPYDLPPFPLPITNYAASDFAVLRFLQACSPKPSKPGSKAGVGMAVALIFPGPSIVLRNWPASLFVNPVVTRK